MDIKTPKLDEVLEGARRSEPVLNFLAQRRSLLVRDMKGPGPNEKQLQLILRLAARVPDHRKLFPWRFLIFQGDARAQFGEHLADKFKRDFPDADHQRTEFERNRFLRAPLVIGVISGPVLCPRGTPKWEQELSAGAVCQNMLLAARASGFGAQWLTEWYAYDADIAEILGLQSSEKIAGFVYIGTPTVPPRERPRPDLAVKVKNWPL